MLQEPLIQIESEHTSEHIIDCRNRLKSYITIFLFFIFIYLIIDSTDNLMILFLILVGTFISFGYYGVKNYNKKFILIYLFYLVFEIAFILFYGISYLKYNNISSSILTIIYLCIDGYIIYKLGYLYKNIFNLIGNDLQNLRFDIRND